MIRDVALEWKRIREVAGSAIMGAEAVARLDGRHEDGGNVEELEANLAVQLMRYCPGPGLEEPESRFMELVADTLELHGRSPHRRMARDRAAVP